MKKILETGYCTEAAFGGREEATESHVIEQMYDSKARGLFQMVS